MESNPPPEYSRSVRRICSDILDLPPSCCEFLPIADGRSMGDYFVVGTYHLQSAPSSEAAPVESDDDDEEKAPAPPKAQERDGSLSLFLIRDEIL
jgi:hypothetical protein